MDDTELQSVVAAEIAAAVAYIDEEIGPERARAIDRYMGRPFGNEEEGRSQVVSRDVHDTIQAILPSLMRIFFGAENVVEFVPEGPDDQRTAEMATDYVNYVVTQDNDGFELFYALIKNALREKVGFVKYWWDEAIHVETKSYTGLDYDGLTALMEDLKPSVEADIVETTEAKDGSLSVKLKLKRKHQRVKLCALPPEEFLISRDARDIDSARYVGHRTMKTVSDLVAMGYDYEEVLEQSQSGDDLDDSDERLARNPYSDDFFDGGPSSDPSQRLVLYVESYIRVDKDGDGISELRKVCTIGPGYRVIHDEECDERPFADFHCDPEPHTFFGLSLADKVMDVERIKSEVMRASLDSLVQTVFPRMVVLDNDGHMEDAQNTEVGALLRARTANGYVPLVTPYVGEQAFPMLSYMDEVRENRTGMSKVSMGLDAEALQNTTATAAEGQFTRSQDRIDLIARIMASGMRRMFRGILRLLVENQGQGRMVRLRSGWEDVDPRAWRTDMDVICTVGLGGGSDREKFMLLSMVAEKQEQILLQLGQANPLVTVKHYRNTLAKLVELGGYRNPDAFFTDPDSPEVQQMLAEAPPPPPSPDEQKLQLEQAKAQGQLQLAHAEGQAKMQLQEAQAASDAELQRLKIEAETQLKREQLAAELDLKREQLAAELQLKRELAAAELELKREQIALNAAAQVHKTDVDAQVSSNVHMGGDPG